MIRCFPTFLSGFVSANLDSFANLLDNFGRFRCRCQLFLADPGAAVTPESHKSFGFTISDGLSSVHFSEVYQISVYFVEIGDLLTKSLSALLVGQHLFLCCFLKIIYFLKTLLSKGKSVRLDLFWMEIVMIFLIKNTYSYWKFMFFDF